MHCIIFHPRLLSFSTLLCSSSQILVISLQVVSTPRPEVDVEINAFKQPDEKKRGNKHRRRRRRGEHPAQAHRLPGPPARPFPAPPKTPGPEGSTGVGRGCRPEGGAGWAPAQSPGRWCDRAHVARAAVVSSLELPSQPRGYKRANWLPLLPSRAARGLREGSRYPAPEQATGDWRTHRLLPPHFPGERLPRLWSLWLGPWDRCGPSRAAVAVRSLPALVGWLGGRRVLRLPTATWIPSFLETRPRAPWLPQRPFCPSPCSPSPASLPGRRPRPLGLRQPLSPPRGPGLSWIFLPSRGGLTLLIFPSCFSYLVLPTKAGGEREGGAWVFGLRGGRWLACGGVESGF